MLANIRVEDGKKSLKLIHLHLQDFKLVHKDLLKSYLHQVLKNPVSVLLIKGLDIEITSKIIHALTVRDFLVKVCIYSKKRMQNGWV